MSTTCKNDVQNFIQQLESFLAVQDKDLFGYFPDAFRVDELIGFAFFPKLFFDDTVSEDVQQLLCGSACTLYCSIKTHVYAATCISPPPDRGLERAILSGDFYSGRFAAAMLEAGGHQLLDEWFSLSLKIYAQLTQDTLDGVHIKQQNRHQLGMILMQLSQFAGRPWSDEDIRSFTDAYLSGQWQQVLSEHGTNQVLSHLAELSAQTHDHVVGQWQDVTRALDQWGCA